MATVQLPGKSTLDMASRKITGVASDVNDDTSAVNYGQIKNLEAGLTLANLGGDDNELNPGPVIYDEASDQYFVESNGDFGVWSPYAGYQVGDRVYFDNILFQCTIEVGASETGINLTPSADIFIKTQRPGATPIPIPGLSDEEAKVFGELNPSWVLRSGLVQEFNAGDQYLKDSIILFEHFGNQQQYKLLFSVQSADTTGDANSPERRAYIMPSSQSNPVQNNFAWYEHYIGGDNGVGDYQVFDFPVPATEDDSPGTAYPGPTGGSGWFIPVGSVWHFNGSNWRFRVPSGSFPDGTLYEVSYAAFVQGTSDASGPSKTAQQHFPPQADSNFWSEENADIHWSAFATYSGGGSIVLYNNRMYSRTGSDVVYVAGGNPTPDQDTGWTDITEDKVSHLLHLPTITNDDGTHSLINTFEGQTLDVVFIDAAYKQDIDGTERQFLHGLYHWDADTTNWLYYASTAAILADATDSASYRWNCFYRTVWRRRRRRCSINNATYCNKRNWGSIYKPWSTTRYYRIS